MKIAILIFSFLNFLLAIISFVPCLIAGAMSMDSPQAQNSWVAHLICYTILSFPLASLACSIIPQFLSGRLALIVSMIPLYEALTFFITLYALSNRQ